MLNKFFFILLSQQIISKCVFTQDCKNANEDDCSTPYEKIFEPTYVSTSKPFECKDIDQQFICCNDSQHTQLSKNFVILDASFGSGNAGCDICSNNLKRLWCHFTCSPDQSDFVKTHGQTKVVDPSDSSKIVEVLNITLTLKSEAACKLFNSCQKTPFVTQVSAMQTAAGFVKFQGKKAVTKGATLINIDFDEKNGLDFPIYGCDYKAINNMDPSNYTVSQNCTCNNCNATCSSQQFNFIDQPKLEGFNYNVVSIFYSILIVLTFIQWKRAKY